jgi:hypothetical protein
MVLFYGAMMFLCGIALWACKKAWPASNKKALH